MLLQTLSLSKRHNPSKKNPNQTKLRLIKKEKKFKKVRYNYSANGETREKKI